MLSSLRRWWYFDVPSLVLYVAVLLYFLTFIFIWAWG